MFAPGTTDHPSRSDVTAIILAGGKGSRMGDKNKGLVLLDDRPLVQHVIERVRPQVQDIVVSANRDIEDYARFGYRVVSDATSERRGPLAGIAAALPYVDTEYVLIVPCDTPFLPPDLVARCATTLTNEKSLATYVHDGGRPQYLVALARRTAMAAVDAFLADGGSAVREWWARVQPALTWYSDHPQAFYNVNTDASLTVLASMQQKRARSVRF